MVHRNTSRKDRSHYKSKSTVRRVLKTIKRIYSALTFSIEVVAPKDVENNAGANSGSSRHTEKPCQLNGKAIRINLNAHKSVLIHPNDRSLDDMANTDVKRAYQIFNIHKSYDFERRTKLH
jgi:hypothetical protein